MFPPQTLLGKLTALPQTPYKLDLIESLEVLLRHWFASTFYESGGASDDQQNHIYMLY
jgi:hypothetical protein